MTSLVMDRPLHDRTEAVPSRPDWFWTAGTGQPAGPRPEESVLVTLVQGERCIIPGGTLAERMMLEGYPLFRVGWATSSRPPFIVQLASERPTEAAPSPASRTAAQAAIAEIRAVSGLTNEEIAPLAGVSRRSIQAWVAGEPISARKENRLRALLEAIRDLAGADSQMTRGRLLDRVLGNVRAYDLLAEGRFEEAVDLASGRRRAAAAPAAPQAQDLYAQLDRHEGRVELPPERLDRRLSGRLR